jgi:DNA-binding XRE family transcriptional regulator
MSRPIRIEYLDHIYPLARGGEHSYGIPEGLQLDHLCRVRCCVNPAHLEPVTNRENSHRGSKLKLTTQQIEEIRNTEYVTRKTLAAKYGISREYIDKIRKGERRTEA